jgi:phospholipase C
LAGLLAGSLAVAVRGVSGAGASGGPVAVLTGAPASAGLSKIKHIIIIMQENRSFDQYFGMYPGADGIPVDANGNPTVCLNDPISGQCVYPWHDASDIQNGGPHGSTDATKDINGGAMNGFISQYDTALQRCQSQPGSPNCGISKPYPDVMGYKLRSDLPEYWAYADNYVLMDHMFAPGQAWSLPEHLYMVSDWAARCYRPGDPTSCENEINAVDDARFSTSVNYAWTDMTYLLDKNHVPWGYYVFNGTEPDCENPGDLTCIPLPQSASTGSIWNPLPYFTDVQQDGTVGNIQSVDNFAAAAQNGTLPAVSWVVPTNSVSEHPPSSVIDGRKYVTYMINQVMQGPDWNSSAIFLAWDDWGGFYDNVTPPTADANGLGIRVPSILISPYAKQGYIDHGVHSFDSYQKFIEDVFLGGQRLDPTTDGRPDPRPTVRENYPGLADLANDFDFTQTPRAPLVIGNTKPNAIVTPIHPRAGAKPAVAKLAQPSAAGNAGTGSIFGNAAATSSATATATPNTGGPLSGVAPYGAVFDGSTSSDANSPIASWTLNFGDGSSTNGTGTPPAGISHTYTTAGSYTADLHIVDQANATADDTIVVNVSAAPPSVWIEGDKPLGFDSDSEHFNAAQSSPGNWTIDWGDGTAAKSGKGTPPAKALHSFKAVGTFTTTLTVTDPTTGLSNVARAITVVSASRAPSALVHIPNVGPTSAQFLADLWSNGQRITYHFEWGTTPSLGNSTPNKQAIQGSSSPATTVTGLTTGTRYYYRVDATNSVGTTDSNIISFVPADGPRVYLSPVTSIGPDTGTLNGQVNPFNSTTTAYFQWGPNGSLANVTPTMNMGSNKAKVPISAVLTGLSPATTYSYDLVATSGVGTTTSATATFTTTAAALSGGTARQF